VGTVLSFCLHEVDEGCRRASKRLGSGDVERCNVGQTVLNLGPDGENCEYKVTLSDGDEDLTGSDRPLGKL